MGHKRHTVQTRMLPLWPLEGLYLFSNMKSRGNGGNMMVLLMVIAATMAAALAIIGQSKLVTLKSSIQFSQGHWKTALLRTVSARAVADLKQILRTSPSCNLNALLTSASTTSVWRANRPNHYPKEWFQFKLVDENGTELPQFYSPTRIQRSGSPTRRQMEQPFPRAST